MDMTCDCKFCEGIIKMMKEKEKMMVDEQV
jgi:hypothetical protein